MFYKSLTVFFSAILLTACGGGESDGDTNLLELEGRWVTGCLSVSGNRFEIDEFIFSGNTFETSIQVWENSSCSGDTFLSGGSSGTFTVGEVITTSSGLEAVEVDLENVVAGAEGAALEILTIFRQEGDELVGARSIDLDVRPTELNFDVIFTRQSTPDSIPVLDSGITQGAGAGASSGSVIITVPPIGSVSPSNGSVPTPPPPPVSSCTISPNSSCVTVPH